MMDEIGLARMKFGKVKYGVRYIDNQDLYNLLRSYFPEFPLMRVRKLNLSLIEHSLAINKIRAVFTQTARIQIMNWWSEEYIRALPEERREGIPYRKNPDAIFWRKRKDGTQQKIFLEYERSLKNKNRYESIFQFYAAREDTKNKNVFYICEDEFIREKLKAIEKEFADKEKIKSTGRYFQFITLKDFNREMGPNNTPTKGEAHEGI
jgi:hypothetical protein